MQMKPQLKVSQPEPSFIDREIRGGKSGWVRSVAPLGGMAIALLGAGSVANAGQWKLKLIEATGKSTWPVQSDYAYGDVGYDYSSIMQGEQPWTSYTNPNGTEGSVQNYYTNVTTHKPGVALTKKEVGGGTAVFEWESKNGYGVSDGSSPDPYLYVKVTSSAIGTASAYVSSEGGANPADSVSLTVSNGYATAEIEKSLANDGQSRHAQGSVTTARLLRFASKGASTITVALPSANVVATALSVALPFVYYYYGYAMTGYRPTSATVSSGAGISVKEDYRGVSIHSSTIEDSYLKGIGPSPTPGRIKHERNPDGSIVTDSAVQWYESSNESFKGWLGGGPFEAPAVGMSNPTYDWDVVGGEYHRYHAPGAPPLSASTPTYDLTPSPLTSIDTWYGILAGSQEDGSDLISSTVVKVKATDPSDGAVAENTFTVNWHLPAEWESSPYYSSTPYWDTMLPTTTPDDNARPNESISGNFQYENFYMGALGEAAPTVLKAGSYFAASGTLGIAQKLLLTMVGLAFEQVSSGEPIDCSFQDAWEMGTTPETTLTNFADYPLFPDGDGDGVRDPRPTLPDGSPDNTLDTQTRYRLTNIRLCVEYQNNWYRGDSFDQHGYIGEVETGLGQRTGREIPVGNFVLAAPDNNPPSPSGE